MVDDSEKMLTFSCNSPQSCLFLLGWEFGFAEHLGNAGLGGFLWVTLKNSAGAGDKAAPDS